MPDFSINQFQPGFILDTKSAVIIESNKGFDSLLDSENESEIQNLIVKIIENIKDMEAIAFSTVLTINSVAINTKVRCQYVNSEKSSISVYLDFNSDRGLLPLDHYHLTSAMPCGMMMIDVSDESYIIRNSNSGLCEMLGYTRAEKDLFYRKNVLTYINRDDIPSVVKRYREQMRKEGRFSVTCRLIKKDRSLLWVNLLGRKSTAPDGRKYLFTVVTNISESVQLIEQLNQEKQAFSVLQKVTHEIVFKYDVLNDTIDFSGRLLKELTGKERTSYTTEDFCSGKGCLKIGTKQLKKIKSELKKGEKKEYTLRVVDLRGGVHWLSVTFDYIHNSDGLNIEIVGKAEDITEKRAAKAYYDKAISLWHDKSNDCEAAITMNISDQQIIGGFSRLVSQDKLLSMSADDYWDSVSPYIVNKQERKRLRDDMSLKNLMSSLEKKNTRFSYDFELNINNTHLWFRLMASVLKNPNTGDIIVLLKWIDINSNKLREKIDNLLYSETFDFICLIFAKTNSFMMVLNIEQNKIIPDSITNGYEEFLRSTIQEYATPEDAQYLRFCFSLKNLKAQLAVNKTYSFIGNGIYPDGSPTVKYHTFQYLDPQRQIILYTRKDITGKANYLSFKDKSKIYNIAFDDILYIESYGKKSHIVTENQQYESNEMLSSIQERLPGRIFYRCHRCYIVRSSAINMIEQNNIVLHSGHKIPVSRSNIAMMRKRYNNFESR